MPLSKNISGKDIALPDIPHQPHHPAATFVYPHEFGKKTIFRRSFQPSWFTNWPWLHYCEDSDVVFCHTSITALWQKKMQLNRGDASFVSKGFSNGTIGFKNHETSASHKEALQVVIVLYYQQLVQILVT